jgi:hypothetical protein
MRAQGHWDIERAVEKFGEGILKAGASGSKGEITW